MIEAVPKYEFDLKARNCTVENWIRLCLHKYINGRYFTTWYKTYHPQRHD